MNRRSFLVRLGMAAAGALAATIDDPERLLWVPGQKTIIDFGATKQVLPATDADVSNVFAEQLFATHDHLTDAARYSLGLDGAADRFGLGGRRDIRVDVANERGDLTSFHFQRQGDGPDKLVSLHTEAELRLLDRPVFPEARVRLERDRLRSRRRA